MIPQFSVCIPAYRNPATLEACLRTVLDQPGDDYEIVVSDDQGPPGIRALVERLAQPDRIRYLRTPQRLGLRGNFEHCVTHSRGRYVTILGDDDGLCRNALDVARTLLASAQPDVFFWFPHIYWWPDALLPHKRWMVYVRAYAKKARLVNAREYVDRFYDDPRNLWLFERLPSIYNGFVCRDLLERIRHRIGGYVYDEVADVSSGIVNGIMATSAALVERPLSIRGLSGSSSGVAFRSKEAGRHLSDDFLRGMHTPLCAAELGESTARAVHLASVRLRASHQFTELADKPIRVADAQRLVNRYGLSGSEFVVPPRFSGEHAKQVGVKVQDDGSAYPNPAALGRSNRRSLESANRLTTATVSSVHPSATMRSSKSASVCCKTDCTDSPNTSHRLCVGRRIENLGRVAVICPGRRRETNTGSAGWLKPRFYPSRPPKSLEDVLVARSVEKIRISTDGAGAATAVPPAAISSNA